MLVVADRSGAEWVKVQIFQFKSLIAVENDKFLEMKEIEINPTEWIEVIRFASELRPKLIVEVFDKPSLELVANEPSVQAYKIPTADLGDKDFVDSICKLEKKIFIGVGGATFNEIDELISQISQYNNMDIVLMHGIQNFPTLLEDSLLNRIQLLKKRYCFEVGFADHIDAEDKEMSRTLPSMAIASGATVIEKHLTLDRSAKGFDYYSALNPNEFKEFVDHMHYVSSAMGALNSTVLTDAEKKYRNKMKKFAVLSASVEKGDKLSTSIVEYRRTSSAGMMRQDIEAHVGKEFTRDINIGNMISEKDFA